MVHKNSNVASATAAGALIVALISSALAAQPSLSDWRVLSSFRPSREIQAAVFKRGEDWAVHRLEDARSDLVNLDYFPVHVAKLPQVDSEPMTPERLLEIVRIKLNDFVDTKISSFRPFDRTKDQSRWFSPKPEGAVILIDVPVIPPAGNTLVDKACVVCAEKTSRYWRFSTIRAGTGWTALNNPSNPGAHPVSGNREFGFVEDSQDGGWIFYTRGCDRATRPMDEFWGVDALEEEGYKLGDTLWLSLQEKLVEFVEANGGEASMLSPAAVRLDWSSVQKDTTVYRPSGRWFSRSDLEM